MKKKRQAEFDYYAEGDVLYITFAGNSDQAMTRDIGEGVFLREDPVSGEVVGITIMDFLQCFLKEVDPSKLQLPSYATDEIQEAIERLRPRSS